MAFAYAALKEIGYIPAAAAAVFTNPAAKTSYARLFIIHNGNTTAEVVKLYAVPNGGSADGSNKFYEETLAAGATRIFDLAAPGLIIPDEGDTIQAETTTASKVTIQIMGGQE